MSTLTTPDRIDLYDPKVQIVNRRGARGVALTQEGLFVAAITDSEACGNQPRTTVKLAPGMLAQAFSAGSASNDHTEIRSFGDLLTFIRLRDGFTLCIMLNSNDMKRLREWAQQSA